MYARELLKALQARTDVAMEVISASDGTLGWMLSQGSAELRRRRPAAVHGPGFLSPWRSPVPVILTVHDLALSRMSAGHPLEWRLFYQLVLPRLARHAAAVLTPTETTRRDVQSIYGVAAERITVTPYGISEQFFGVRRAERSDGSPRILFAGPPIARKNLDLVIRAMGRAKSGSAVARAQLIVTGAREEDFPNYRDLIDKNGLRARVTWTGPLSHQDMPATYASADVLAYPSFIEGFGFPPLEAMATGTPAIASNVSCLPEVLDDSAILVDPYDESAFLSALESLLTDDAVRERVIQAGSRRARMFTWDRCAQLTAAVYRRVAEETR